MIKRRENPCSPALRIFLMRSNWYLHAWLDQVNLDFNFVDHQESGSSNQRHSQINSWNWRQSKAYKKIRQIKTAKLISRKFCKKNRGRTIALCVASSRMFWKIVENSSNWRRIYLRVNENSEFKKVNRVIRMRWNAFIE